MGTCATLTALRERYAARHAAKAPIHRALLDPVWPTAPARRAPRPEPTAPGKPPRKPIRWRLLLDVAQQLVSPFTLSALVVAAWQAHPAEFGLRGYPQYPCSNTVRVELYGRRGLIARGELVKSGDKFVVEEHADATRD